MKTMLKTLHLNACCLWDSRGLRRLRADRQEPGATSFQRVSGGVTNVEEDEGTDSAIVVQPLPKRWRKKNQDGGAPGGRRFRIEWGIRRCLGI